MRDLQWWFQRRNFLLSLVFHALLVWLLLLPAPPPAATPANLAQQNWLTVDFVDSDPMLVAENVVMPVANETPLTTPVTAVLTEGIPPEVIEPETVEPEIVEPETKKPEIIEPEIVEPEIVETETVEPEIIEPEIIEPEIVEPETKKPEIVEPETKKPETKKPEIAWSADREAALAMFEKSDSLRRMQPTPSEPEQPPEVGSKVEDFADLAYGDRIARILQVKWRENSPFIPPTGRCRVAIDINPGGYSRFLEVIDGDCDFPKDYHPELRAAIEKANPLPVPPKEFVGRVVICFGCGGSR